MKGGVSDGLCKVRYVLCRCIHVFIIILENCQGILGSIHLSIFFWNSSSFRYEYKVKNKTSVV